MKKNIATMLMLSFLMLPLAAALPAMATTATVTAPNWNITGSYVMAMNLQSTNYPHDMVLAQDSSGNLTGNGGSPAGGSYAYTWVITSGSVVGNTMSFSADYTTSTDAVNPQTTMVASGTIAADGSISGTWSDNYQGGARSGTWSTTSGNAVALGTLSAQDFGVMNVSDVMGYTAGFGLTDASFAGATSIVTQLYSGDTLLQTDTATNPSMFSGFTQFSSPFDVFGTFDYATDAYWTNVRGLEYGQTLTPTKVVATVTLANGKIVTAENTNLTGDPTTIFPVVATSTPTVTIENYINGAQATASSAQGLAFPMTESYTIGGIAGVSAYTLSPTGINTPNAYEAITSPLDASSSYTTNEIIGGSVVGTCASGTPFALAGYSTGATLAAAASSSISTTMPSFTSLSGNEFVIVQNVACVGNSSSTGGIGGTVISSNGVLKVTSITVTKSTSTADGLFADGWQYVFHITAPTSESLLSMSFADWINTANASSVIPVANDMEIASPQANNAGAEILLTAANNYSAPLTMVTDLDPTTSGRQVDVMVNVAVPVGTATGAYTTSYGVQTNP
jgi:hypothetical protein